MTIPETEDPAPAPVHAAAATTNDSAMRTVKIDAAALRKLVVSTVLDLGEESDSQPVEPAPGRLPEDGSL